VLQRTNAPKPIVWVNDQQDYDQYKLLFPELEIMIGGSNIGQKRNLIQEHYPLGTKIVMIDDDVKNIVVLDHEEQKKKRNLVDFNALVNLGFSLSEKQNSTFWGVYPIDTPLVMKGVIRTNPCYCIGTLFGIVNKRVLVETNYAEDFERSLLYYKLEGKLCRLDFVSITTRYYKEKGGLQVSERFSNNTKDKETIIVPNNV
jgi:hypothetical protein